MLFSCCNLSTLRGDFDDNDEFILRTLKLSPSKLSSSLVSVESIALVLCGCERQLVQHQAVHELLCCDSQLHVSRSATTKIDKPPRSDSFLTPPVVQMSVEKHYYAHHLRSLRYISR
ncbi:hypothetical protein Ae201684P_001271 [Aphanomyces euteiches]|uniref:Uncharacterized protein n=1 Tax=Aphanomyces euteiches TaxID=100861 RepID=A0A6G0WQ89_9STRA|nr:hypothetical protein Ae201684_012866 [Aphanomyces euteiches]KAH9097796.1 hypothetical protein Ae201684P_001271 [Aphanomyces euteiches]